MPYRVSNTSFAELVKRAVEDLPPEFAEFLEEVPIEIRTRPTAEQMKRLGLRRNDLLLGLYEGRPRTRRSVLDSGTMPDVIYIFQEHIELISNTEDDLVRQVRTTVLHEIGHHFGMSEGDLEGLGFG